MKAEGSLLKPAQHTDGMDLAFFQPELSRGFLSLTKLVKCCAALNKRLQLTVNLSSRPSRRAKLLKGCLLFSQQEKNLFHSIFSLDVWLSWCALQSVNSSDRINVNANNGKMWRPLGLSHKDKLSEEETSTRKRSLAKLMWQLVSCCSLLTCSGGQTLWWPQPKVSTSLDNPRIQRKWGTSWRKL